MEAFIASAYSISVILTFVVCLGALAVLMALDTPAAAARREARLSRELAKTPMIAVLRRLGVKPDLYMRRIGAKAMAQQLRRCRACERQAECEGALHRRGVDIPIARCANRAELLAS